MPTRKVHPGTHFVEFIPTAEEKKVSELEAQVKTLTELVQKLASGQEEASTEASSSKKKSKT